jgi:methyl-accepting chemotaxis protein
MYRKRLGVGIAAQLISPFAIISVLTTLVLGITSCWTMNNALKQSLEEKSEILTRNLSSELADPLSMGEYDRLQQILEAAEKSDQDLFYAAVVSADGRALATTDVEERNRRLNRNDFERSALNATNFMRRETTVPGIFEMVMPISTAGGQAGVLRVGISSQRVQSTIQQAEIQIALIGLVALVVGITVYITRIGRTILNPTMEVVRIATRVSRGDLGETIDVTRKDEIGQLLESMNLMVAYLREMALIADSIAKGDLSVRVAPRSESDVFGNALEKMVESLHAIILELAEGAQALSTAATEMATTSTQQSASISEQAVSIRQSLQTLEEIRMIVQQASEQAKSVVEISGHSLDVSRAGQDALQESVAAMVKIKEQVQEIADNIAELGEKTVQIGEITASVNDIADQSNLLAVNAAIEAARAGQASRGFGVVASEVKNLASQSKRATAQVHGILGEIQKATTSTVVVTEEGKKRVESGVQQVHQIGTNFNQLYQVIEESSNAAKQIAAATNQQVAGIEQVALGMRSISEAANESVAGAAQQSSTAQNLSELAISLNNIVRRYRLRR